MSQNGKLMPNLDQQSTKLLNLTVLQRIDPFIEEILIMAAHVTFYEFNIDLSIWSRKDVEGSIFVVKRNTQPRFQFVVMNRRNTVYGSNKFRSMVRMWNFVEKCKEAIGGDLVSHLSGKMPQVSFFLQDCKVRLQLLVSDSSFPNWVGRIPNAYSKVPQKSKVATSKRLGFLVMQMVEARIASDMFMLTV
ncbi:hypothetical protein CUMW_239910 [Citrus unshiu]|uniref:mRNA-decapping enzyme-like protein n=1 Tax=Citrus unshiu TaxID=55188 RepID=A0A2H5QM20_CITUN|nr:hypothetical protein CUMW_239910 [Citrus unshiu]